ncbi:MAG: hypothetical protein QXL19_10485 [Ignisphaera sp.]
MSRRSMAINIAGAIIAIAITVNYIYAQYIIGDMSNAVDNRSRWFYGFRLDRGILRHYIVEVSDEYRTRIEKRT